MKYPLEALWKERNDCLRKQNEKLIAENAELSRLVNWKIKDLKNMDRITEAENIWLGQATKAIARTNAAPGGH